MSELMAAWEPLCLSPKEMVILEQETHSETGNAPVKNIQQEASSMCEASQMLEKD